MTARVGIAGAILALVLTAVLGIDVALPQGLLDRGPTRARDIVAPTDRDFGHDQDREAREAAVRPSPISDYTTANAIAVAAASARLREPSGRARRGVRRRHHGGEAALLDSALAELDLPEGEAETLLNMEGARWRAVRTEAGRVLDVTMRFEVRDSEVESTKLALADQMAGDLNEDERLLAALITPLIVGNSSYSADLTIAAGERAAAAVQDVRVHIEQGQVIAPGRPDRDAELEALEALGLNDGEADLATFAGWFLFASLVVGLLLAGSGASGRGSGTATASWSSSVSWCSVRRSRSSSPAARS